MEVTIGKAYDALNNDLDEALEKAIGYRCQLSYTSKRNNASLHTKVPVCRYGNGLWLLWDDRAMEFVTFATLRIFMLTVVSVSNEDNHWTKAADGVWLFAQNQKGLEFLKKRGNGVALPIKMETSAVKAMTADGSLGPELKAELLADDIGWS